MTEVKKDTNLLLLSKGKRDSILIAIAKETYLKELPEIHWIFDDEQIEIKSHQVNDKEDPRNGWTIYKVKLHSHYYKEGIKKTNITTVYVWGENSKPAMFLFGDGRPIVYDD